MSSKAYTRKPTADEVAQEAMALASRLGVAETGLVDPEQAETTAHETISAEADEIQIDPQMLQQTIANKNARLIAVLVNETAMFEVALETERRANGELRAKNAALEAALAALSA